MGRIGLGVDQRRDGANRWRKERPVGREAIGCAQRSPPNFKLYGLGRSRFQRHAVSSTESMFSMLCGAIFRSAIRARPALVSPGCAGSRSAVARRVEPGRLGKLAEEWSSERQILSSEGLAAPAISGRRINVFNLLRRHLKEDRPSGLPDGHAEIAARGIGPLRMAGARTASFEGGEHAGSLLSRC